MVDSSILLAVPWTFLHFAAMLVFGVTSVESFALYLVASFVITNVLVSLLKSCEYNINKLRFILYACAVLVPVVFGVAFLAVSLRKSAYPGMADPIISFVGHTKPNLLGVRKDTPYCCDTHD